MIRPVSSKFDAPYAFTALYKPPAWERASKAALIAFSALAEEILSTQKEGRKIKITMPPVGREAIVHMSHVPAAAPPPAVKVPFDNAEVAPFPQHAKKDVEKVSELLTMLDEVHVLGLTLVMFRLADIGDEIAHLHPFTFAKIALTDPILRARLYRIIHSMPKRVGLMNGNGIREGFSHQLNRESKRNSLEPYIDAFAASLNLPPDEIRKLVIAHRWTDLFYYLTQKTMPPVNQSSRV